jgi:hypothetical protein
MGALLSIIFAVLTLLVLVVAWSALIGGKCSKDSQCPTGYGCSSGSSGSGKCVPTGS